MKSADAMKKLKVAKLCAVDIVIVSQRLFVSPKYQVRNHARAYATYVRVSISPSNQSNSALQALVAGAKLANSAPPEDKAKYLEMLAWYVAALRCSQGSL